MLKMRAIFWVLLIVLCADGCANKVKDKDHSQKPTEQTTLVAQKQTDGAAFHGEDQKDIHAKVEIVNPPQKDFYDEAPFWVNCGLVVAAFFTLLAIRRQANLMKEQMDLMTEKDRAKLRIELDSFQPLDDKFGLYNVRGRVCIYGSSEAFIKTSEAYAGIGAGSVFSPQTEWLFRIHGLPEVLKPNAEPIPFSVIVCADDGPADADQILPVRKAGAEIHCMAKIVFTDAYRRDWELRLRRRFKFIWSQLDSPTVPGDWEDSGPASDNGEYRIKKWPFLPVLWQRLRFYWRSRGGRRIPRP